MQNSATIHLSCAIVLMGMFSTAALAEVRSKPVEYKVGDQVFEGYVAWESDRSGGPAPGVLMVPDWLGNDEYARKKADQIAAMGYSAFVVDMYGKGVRPSGPKEAGALAGKLKADRAAMRQRVNAALAAFRDGGSADSKRIFAIGYCFGGTTVLELARSGADVLGVVTFHGGLDSPTPDDAKNIKAKVLVLHGADDPFVPAKEVAGFWEEMRKGKVDWQMNYYSGAVHSFTRPDAGNDPSKGAAYNAEADRRSWAAMKLFFTELLGGK